MKSIRELLSDRKPVTIAGGKSIIDAVRLMKGEKVGAVLVVNADGSPEGCFTERDLMFRVVAEEKSLETTKVSEVMTRDLFTAGLDERINDVAQKMQDRHIRHLPVMDGGKVVGMLSLRDLLREHIAVKRHEVEALTAYIKGEEA